MTSDLHSQHTEDGSIRELGERLRNASIAYVLLLWLGTEGYYLLGQGKWSFFDCFYMTVISITSVGFSEVIPVHKVPMGRIFTTILIFFGMAINYYFISTLTAFFLGEEFKDVWWRRNMKRMTDRQQEHIVVCGAGETGFHVIQELLTSRWNITVVDQSQERLRNLQDSLGSFSCVVGDATDDMVLERAGIERAYGLIAVLTSDKDNLFVTITARRLNPRLKIVSKGIDLKTIDKLKQAGANRVVSTNYIGGIRLAAEVVRPHVVQFLELLASDNDLDLLIEEAHLPLDSQYAGKRLRDTDLRQKELLVLAVHSPADGSWNYNPKPDYIFEPLSTLIVLGHTSAVKAFHDELDT